MTPEQTKAIKQFMTNRKRQLMRDHTKRKFPKFTEGMSAWDYVHSYQTMNMDSFYSTAAGQLRFDCDNYFFPATINTEE